MNFEPTWLVLTGLSLDLVGFAGLVWMTRHKWIRREVDIARVMGELIDPNRKAVIFPWANLARTKDRITYTERQWMADEHRATKWNRLRRWLSISAIVLGFALQIVGQALSSFGEPASLEVW